MTYYKLETSDGERGWDGYAYDAEHALHKAFYYESPSRFETYRLYFKTRSGWEFIVEYTGARLIGWM
jgi:hypothetical protein